MSNGGDTSKDRPKSKVLNPLEVNGITAVTLGTILWTIALVILILERNWLISTSRIHWLWISGSGVCLGLLGLRYTVNRIKRLNSDSQSDQKNLIQDFE